MAHRLPLGFRDPTPWVAGAGLLLALVAGIAIAIEPQAGLALALGPAYAVLAFTNLAAGLAAWVPLAFLEGIPALNAAGKAAGLLLALAWLGALYARRRPIIPALRSHRLALLGIGGILAWFSLSLAWSQEPGRGLEDLWHWYALALLFAIVVTTVTTERAVRMVFAAFVTGALISVVTGVVDGSLTSAVEGGARFGGGSGDPNILAASLIPAAVLAGALLAETRSALGRGGLLAAIALLIAGVVASGSRGGALAAAATVVAAFVVFRQRRSEVLAVSAVVVGAAALTFASAPSTWERVTDFEQDNGRSDLWTVAWRVGEQQPLTGVGLNNFTAHSSQHVREPGSLEAVGLIVDRPHEVHNIYLQLYAEGGLVVLALFALLVGACLSAAHQAATRFDARGEPSLATLARSVIVATIGMLAAFAFLSTATDKRLWLLLALGPALLTVAATTRGERSS